MITMMLKRRARKVKGVDATLHLKVGVFKSTIRFGEGRDDDPDYLEFRSLTDFFKKKPTSSKGYGYGILAFKEAMNGS